MKTGIKNLFLVLALIAGLGLILADRATAQTFTNLHSFTATSGPLSTNSDGALPSAESTLSGNILYGAASHGGSSGKGTVFAINTDGSGFTNLHSFMATSGPNDTNSEGAFPSGPILSGTTLYGTTYGGGSSGNGTVFAVNTDGTGFTNLHSFTQGLGPYPGTNDDGLNPRAGLILSGNTLYGTADRGGSWGHGTVFKVNTDGTGFTTLHTFTTTDLFTGTNSDGSDPIAVLIISGNTLYGTAHEGGSAGWGTVFAVNTAGSGFTNLHSFNYGSDGGYPSAGLILSANTLYGTTRSGGSSGKGTVFAVNTDGSGFTNLHSFTGGSDGTWPQGRLSLSGNTLYGTTYGGVFAVNIDGSGFTNLHSFTGSDGVNLLAGLILSDNTLYGTASQGGNSGNGTVFSLALPPPPKIDSIEMSGQNPLLSFSTVTGLQYVVEYSPDLTPGSWTNLPNGSVSGDGNPAQVTDTNFPMSAARYYRLKQSP